jgi:O-acetyl-ADP-ribose deacetylase (regulator of RNase III)
MTLEVVQGDITDQTTDAIVNAANDHLWLGGGVAGAIRTRGGEEIEAEAMAQGPIVPGDCVITGAGRLPAKHVIHAAVMGQDLQTSAEIIDAATRNTLRLAEANGLESIALPAFGTGVGGFPVDECAKIMIDAVHAHQATSVRLVRFVLFGERAYRAFVAAAHIH